MNASMLVKQILAKTHQNPKKEGFAFAPVNFALIKYWGKRDATLNLPITSSLSISLPEKGAFTYIKCIDSPSDQFFLNHLPISLQETFSKRASEFLDLFRTEKNYHFQVKTHMNLPEASGLASSACGYAALTLALNQLFDWQLDSQHLSILARLGSGSACRSLSPGFVEWDAGQCDDGMDSYAQPLNTTWDSLCMGLLLLNTARKPISSREAMQQTTATSCYYPLWPDKVIADLSAIKSAIQAQDFERFGQICESNALAMHASMLTAWPPIFYWTPESLQTVHKIWQLRRDGLPIYFTQDAGPNLKLLFLKEHLSQVQTAFEEVELVWPFVQNDDYVVIVDEQDRAKRMVKKMEAHEKALCHRAFSIFIFRKSTNGLEVLMQQRQQDKYHCGGLWTNTCCSHPRPGESLLDAANRRLKEEVGVEAPLLYKGSFHYIAEFDNHLTENEIDHVFVSYEDPGRLSPDHHEIANLQWVEVETLRKSLQISPQNYTPWLGKALEVALS